MGINDLQLVKLGLESDLKPTRYIRFIRQLVRMRFQFVAGLLFAVVFPAVIADLRMGVNPFTAPLNDHLDASLLATSLAFILSFLIFRKVTAFPGVRASAYIVPTFLTSYAIASLLFFALRSQFSMVQMGVSLISTCLIFYATFYLLSRARLAQMNVVPGGDVARLRTIKTVTWRFLVSPEDARLSSGPIIVDLREDLSPEWERFIADSALSGRYIYSAKDVVESMTGRVQVEHISENTFGASTPNSIYAPLKRYLDVLLALLALSFLAPFLLTLALAIRLESAGPALFTQERMGFRGVPFKIYKLRTMREISAERGASGDNIFIHDARRITGLGRFLRKWRIDELPQLINILRGEMSWIGPRPEAMALSQAYAEELPFYSFRHIVRPGLTGWAQVSQGHVVGVDSANTKLQFDFFYVKNFSLWLDVLVVLRTIRVVLTGFGSR